LITDVFVVIILAKISSESNDHTTTKKKCNNKSPRCLDQVDQPVHTQTIVVDAAPRRKVLAHKNLETIFFLIANSVLTDPHIRINIVQLPGCYILLGYVILLGSVI